MIDFIALPYDGHWVVAARGFRIIGTAKCTKLTSLDRLTSYDKQRPLFESEAERIAAHLNNCQTNEVLKPTLKDFREDVTILVETARTRA